LGSLGTTLHERDGVFAGVSGSAWASVAWSLQISGPSAARPKGALNRTILVLAASVDALDDIAARLLVMLELDQAGGLHLLEQLAE